MHPLALCLSIVVWNIICIVFSSPCCRECHGCQSVSLRKQYPYRSFRSYIYIHKNYIIAVRNKCSNKSFATVKAADIGNGISAAAVIVYNLFKFLLHCMNIINKMCHIKVICFVKQACLDKLMTVCFNFIRLGKANKSNQQQTMLQDGRMK